MRKRLIIMNKYAFLGLLGLLTACAKLQPTAVKPLPTAPTAFPGQIPDSTSRYTKADFFFDPELLSLIEEGLQQNRDLLALVHSLEAQQAQILYYKGLRQPKVDANLNLGLRRFGSYTMDGVGNYDTQFSTNISPDQIIPEHLPELYLGLQMQWEADIWGKIKQKKQGALERYLAEAEGRNWAQTLLIEQIALAYYELIAYDIELDILEETVNLQSKELELIRLQKEAGRADELAVKQFEAQLFATQGMRFGLLQGIAELEGRLNALIGRYPQPVKRNKQIFEAGLPQPRYNNFPATILANRADIRQAERLMLATKADLASAKAAFYPSLNLSLGLGFQSFNPKYWLNPSSLAYNALGGAIAPLINRSALQADFNFANAKQAEAAYRYQQSILNASAEIFTQMQAIENYRQAQALKQQENEALRFAIEASMQLFLNGRSNALELIFLRRNALQARFELVTLRKMQFMSVVRLYKAIGGSWQ